MRDQVTVEGDRLLAVLDRALGGAAPLDPDEGAPPPPSPWLVWLVVVLCRQRVRQRWLVEIAAILEHHDAGRSGDVPGMPGWTYDFHGIGLCLNGPDHECLDVDFHDEAVKGATIDPYFFARRIDALDPRPAPEARVYGWLSSPSLICLALDVLRAWGLITHPSSPHVFRLCPWLERRVDRIAADGFALARGDDVAEDDGSRERYLAWLWSEIVTDRKTAAQVIVDVARTVGASAEPWCLQLLDGPVDHATANAVEALRAMPGDHSAAVEAVLDRLASATHHPYIAHAVASYVLARGHQRERALTTAIAFAEVEVVTGYRGNPYLDHLAMLVLEHDPARGLPLVRRALRSSTPGVVGRVASLLAALDQPWSRRELASALGANGQTDTTNRRQLAAALVRSRDPASRRAAIHLMPGEPERDPDQIGYTFEEIVADAVDEDWYSDDVAPIAARLRTSLPDLF